MIGDPEKLSKKKAVTAKSVVAKAQKAQKLAKEAVRIAREKDDQYWRETEGTKSRSAKKREEKIEKQDEKANRKAENRRLAKQEAEDIQKALNRSVKKVMAAELQLMMEQQPAANQKIVKDQSRIVTKKQYKRMILVPNTNCPHDDDDDDDDEAIIDEAILQLIKEQGKKEILQGVSRVRMRKDR